MAKEADIEYILATAEQKRIREMQMFRERQRQAKRDRELQKRERITPEIAQIRGRG